MKTTVNENKNREFETPKLKLTAEHVKEIFLDCFLPEKYTDDTKVIPVKAVTGNFGFQQYYRKSTRSIITTSC